MHEISDSQLLRNEAMVYRHTSQTLLKLAEDLCAAGSILESKANDIEREAECVKIAEARRRRTPQKLAKSDYDGKVEDSREILEGRSAACAMIAANTLKQEKIINTAVQSLVQSDLGLLEQNSREEKAAGGEMLSQLDPDHMPTFVCYLSAGMLTESRLMVESEKAEKAEPAASSKYASCEELLTEGASSCSITPASPCADEQRP